MLSRDGPPTRRRTPGDRSVCRRRANGGDRSRLPRPGPRPDAAAVEAVNAVLAHGRRGILLRPEGPDTHVEVDAPSWLPAWLAAEDYLRLLAERPDRIRACGNPECILHFYDVSKNGTRRWCSMAGCGNRAKAQRHYARQKKA